MTPSTRSLMQPTEIGQPTAPEDVIVDVLSMADPDTVEIIFDENGQVLLAGELSDDVVFPKEHHANLAHVLDKQMCTSLGQELMELVRADIQSQSTWEHLYEKGLELLSLSDEPKTEPWPGASNAKHPMLMEAMVRYQSDTIREIFPATGPAATYIVGKKSPERMALAERVKTELNYQTASKIPGYKTGLEQILLMNAFGGSAYRKVCYDPLRRVPCAKLIPAVDVIPAYGSASLYEGERFALKQNLSRTEWKSLSTSGDWVMEPDPASPATASTSDDMASEAMGVDRSYLDRDVTLYEIYTYLDNPELFDGEEPEVPAPFILVIDKEHECVRSIRRNWAEDDDTRTPLQHVSEYQFIPSPFGRPFGLIHLLGSLTKAGTALIQQIIDSNTMNNVVSGFKSRGLKMTNSAQPLEPGEFRDVENLEGKIADNLMFLPSRQTDPTSLQLLQAITAEAKNLASAPDVKTSDASAAATGAMMAVLERALSVMSAVQSRAADALGTELTILKRIIAEDMPGSYEYETEGGVFSRAEDFKASVGIRCVADPSASTQAMRILRNQAITAQASQNPDLYDQSELHRRVMRDLGVEDIGALIPRAGEAPQRDPVSENQALMIGQAVKAFMGQDHQAHIAVHMAAMEDPSIQAFVGQSQNGPKIQAAAQAHIMEHLALQYREAMEQQLGFPLPPPGEPLPADIENQIAQLAAQAKVQNLGPAPQAQEQAPDPIVMMQQQELQLKQMQLQMEQQKLQMQSEMAAAKLQHQADIAAMNARIAMRQDETNRERAILAAEVEMARIQEDGADKRAERAVKIGIASEQIAQKDRIEGVKAGLEAARVQQTAQDLRNTETPAPEGTDE